MRKFVIRILVLSLLILYVGCATTPIATRDAADVPSKRHISYKVAQSDTVPVLVKRDVGLVSSGCATRVFVNGRLAALIRAGEKVVLHIPAGEVILGAEPDRWCAGGLVEREATLSLGKPKRYRIGYDHNGSIGLFPTATE